MRQFEITKAYQNKDICLPIRQTGQSAGYDLESAETITIEPQAIVLVPTGLKVLVPTNEALFIFPRSSLGIKKGLMMSNSVGIIDADYYNNPDNEGHIMVPLFNFRNQSVTIEKGERIAQGVFLSYHKVVGDASENIQRLGGFGSSGQK
ncbi:MAG: dUTP diphosphatase [Acholeplasmataceae bacterium]